MKFTIDYATWRCGHEGRNRLGAGNTCLLNDEQFMCCLGQVSLQLGLTRNQIRRKFAPHDVQIETILCEQFPDGTFCSTELAGEAMKINDHVNSTPFEKMAKLKSLFAEHGHELEFVNVPEESNN